MKITVKVINFTFAACLFLFGCSKDNNPVDQGQSSDKFGIYFLKDTTLKIQNLLNADLTQIQIQDKPWISEDDISFYDWSSHCIYLKSNKDAYFPKFLDGMSFPKNWWDKPYAMAINNKVLSIGYFHSIFQTDGWPFPDIPDGYAKYFPNDILHINWPYISATDKRNNEEVKAALAKSGLLHLGLKVVVDSLWINNADTATVTYKYTVSNLDSDNLYVLDSDKMGTELFHYFTNGISFFNKNTNKVYDSKYKKYTQPEPFDSWEGKWFTKLEAGKSITRKTTLKGYPRLSGGEYLFKFTFCSPVNIDRQSRSLSDGRYWVGFSSSELLGFNLAANHLSKKNFYQLVLQSN